MEPSTNKNSKWTGLPKACSGFLCANSLLNLDGEWCSRVFQTLSALPFSGDRNFRTPGIRGFHSQKYPMFPTKSNVQGLFALYMHAFQPPPEEPCTPSGRCWTHTQPFLPVPLRPISAGLPGLSLQLQGKYSGPFPYFPRDRTCRPAEKSNYKLLSWWNPITTSPMVRANPFDVKGSKTKRFQAGDVPVFYLPSEATRQKGCRDLGLFGLETNGQDLLLPTLP